MSILIDRMGKTHSGFGFEIAAVQYEESEWKSFGFFRKEFFHKRTAYFHTAKQLWLVQGSNDVVCPEGQVMFTKEAMRLNMGELLERGFN